jgi:hypothetical protein
MKQKRHSQPRSLVGPRAPAQLAWILIVLAGHVAHVHGQFSSFQGSAWSEVNTEEIWGWTTQWGGFAGGTNISTTNTSDSISASTSLLEDPTSVDPHATNNSVALLRTDQAQANLTYQIDGRNTFSCLITLLGTTNGPESGSFWDWWDGQQPYLLEPWRGAGASLSSA